jgi:parvulin-like peptidyl-prolyl isomerase
MLTIAAMLSLGYYQATPPPKPAPETVMATVGGTPITAGEVEPYLWAWRGKEIAKELTGHKMIAIEAARRNITLSEAEVQKRVEDQLNGLRAQLQPGQTLDDVVNGPQVGGPSRLSLIARSSLLVDKIAEADFKPDGYVKVATLIFRTTGDSTDALSKAIRSADQAYASLQTGKPWQDVLRVYEKEPRIVENGGLIGWKAYDVFPESVRTQLGTLKLMGVTKPIQTEFGIQIFRILARGASATPAELTDLKTLYIQGSRNKVVEKMKQTIKVEMK